MSVVIDFYPRPLRGGRQSFLFMLVNSQIFLSTPSARRATTLYIFDELRVRNFYPRPLRGGRHCKNRRPDSKNRAFLSTPSARRATIVNHFWQKMLTFLSTPSARRATGLQKSPLKGGKISIHALCEEGDVGGAGCWEAGPAISIHALCEEGDRAGPDLWGLLRIFLSTPSARRATHTA